MASAEKLLRPLEGESPAGPDLTYDEKRLEIERAFEAAASLQPGESDSTEWRQVIQLILDQAERTRDIWLPIYLIRAGARADRLDTVELGCDYLAGLVDSFWETMHPQLEDYGFQGRKGPCESLVRIGEFIGPLKRMIFVAHPRLGSFSGNDVDRFASDGDAAEGYGMFRAALDDLPSEDLQATIARLDRIRQSIARVDEALSAHADGDTGTNFAPTYAALESIRLGLAAYAGMEAESGPAVEDGEPAAAAAPAREGARPRGSIESRDDVLAAFDAIVDYYRRREPGSPVPVAVARAKSWVTMDFLAVLEDIAPESVGEARRVLTSQQSDNDLTD